MAINFSSFDQYFTNHLSLSNADDTIHGGFGNDMLSGGMGDDYIVGGAGSDTMTGGDGNDIFVFDTKSSGISVDTITDFTEGEDKIYLSHKILKGYAAGADLTNDFVSGNGATAQDATDHFIYDTFSGALYFDKDGAGGKDAIKIAELGTGTHPTLTASDLIIF